MGVLYCFLLTFDRLFLFCSDLNLPIVPIAGLLVVIFLHLKIPIRSAREIVLQLDWLYVQKPFDKLCSLTIPEGMLLLSVVRAQ